MKLNEMLFILVWIQFLASSGFVTSFPAEVPPDQVSSTDVAISNDVQTGGKNRNRQSERNSGSITNSLSL
jgi:hypothetical protein